MPPILSLPLIGMPPLYDRTAEGEEHRHVQRITRWFAARKLCIVDVPYDGNCALHAVAPAFVAWLGRPTTTMEIRAMLISVWMRGPMFQDELEHELGQEVATASWPAESTVRDLLEHLSRPATYLPPVLVARGTTFITGKRMQTWFMGTGVEGQCEPYPLCDGDDDGTAAPQFQILYIEQLRHVCRLERIAD